MTDDKQWVNTDNLTPWKPGESGNPNGRPPNSVTTLLKNRKPEDNQKVADKLYQLALRGDMSAIREYIDRTDGKVTDTHRIEGEIPVSIVYKRVKNE